MTIHHLLQQLRVLCRSGKTIDQALVELRTSGASIIQCIKVVREYKGCSIQEAKQLVHHSDAWRDLAEATDNTWDEFTMGTQRKKAEQVNSGDGE